MQGARPGLLNDPDKNCQDVEKRRWLWAASCAILSGMSKSERLLSLLQALRAYRRPVSAERLASELNVSIRTIYRDVVSLNAQGATIEGEAGIGYVLRPGFLLPPLMFDDEEIEALVLGSRWVMQRGDKPLAAAARNALTKIAAGAAARI